MPKQTELKVFSVDCTSKEYLHLRQQLMDAGAAVIASGSREDTETGQQPLLYAAVAKITLDPQA